MHPRCQHVVIHHALKRLVFGKVGLQQAVVHAWLAGAQLLHPLAVDCVPVLLGNGLAIHDRHPIARSDGTLIQFEAAQNEGWNHKQH